MKVVAFIPIKLNNERFPNKNIKCFFDGTPLIHFVQKTLLKCKEVDDIYIFCSDEAIKPYILDGIKFLQRPTNLDTKETLAADLIQAFSDAIDSDIYILACATSPFVKLKTYQECINTVKLGNFDSAFAGGKMQKFVWYKNAPLNFTLDKAPRTQDMQPIFYELSSPYVFTKDVFKKYHGRTSENPYIHEGSLLETIDIDYHEDFEVADILYRRFIKNEQFW
ncbi:CMP-N-acetylneuraminic acid synthetase [Helicobacter sp. MIT 00-7814]|nr:CMP-N-acetylneuraminic acid synthetase [Helicobacter sp. MIT 00-7814]RDU57783.1 CMP-N-acetylneuraminic acid synthetase [Helicobacter sp. MIT 99-10781]